MKYALIVSVLCLLTGCWQTVDSYDISKAMEKCGSIDNVYQIEAHFTGSEIYKCFEDRTK